MTFEGEAGGVQRRSFTVTMVLREEVRVAETYVRVVQDRYEDKETVVMDRLMDEVRQESLWTVCR